MMSGAMTDDPNKSMRKSSDAEDRLRQNLSMSDDADVVVGSGLRGVNVERAEQIQEQIEKEKERKRKQAQREVDSIIADIRAMEAEMANFENAKFGGLGGLGAQVGVARKAGESDEEYRKSIRDNIQAQMIAGTLEDPDGDIREWARQYDEIQARKNDLNHGSQIQIEMIELQSTFSKSSEILEMGLAKLDMESNNEFEQRIRDEIQVRVENGTLDDPEGLLQEWAVLYDKAQKLERELQESQEANTTISETDIALNIDETSQTEDVLTVIREKTYATDSQDAILNEAVEQEDSVDSFSMEFLAAFPPVQEDFTTAASGYEEGPSSEIEQAPEAPAVSNLPKMNA